MTHLRRRALAVIAVSTFTAACGGAVDEPDVAPVEEAAQSGGGSGTATFKILASNDLGMHCACPSFSTFMLLPPYNTLRAQVLQTGGVDPVLLGASNQYKVTYSVLVAPLPRLDAIRDYCRAQLESLPDRLRGLTGSAGHG